MKYCKNCSLKFKETDYAYCPYCAATLIEIVELESGLFQITPINTEGRRIIRE